MPDRWDYLSEACILREGFFPGDPGEAAYLTAQGLLGWELVTVLRTAGGGGYAVEMSREEAR